MSLKEVISFLIIAILGMGLGYYFASSSQTTSEIPAVIPTELVEEEYNKIDSLESIILEKDEVISSLTDSIQVIEVVRTDEVERISELPIDSAALYLKQKLREYENNF